MRAAALVAAALLLAVGGYLAFIAVVAVRRSEGVFVPAGAVALLCLVVAYWLGRVGLGISH